ncbi:phage holin family protein [Enterococcus villorum]|uniref:Membrane protein n=2 Tax=Enterococcus villorum TaxID=112904 RepID=A0A511J4G2_9ENTE|nr:phage holin family protein [Enterococcus villorum]EOH85758.1 membrane protein [Enterococcus villorum ATCC 700913]EOW78663.1 membrane protein [Enterococcus villorum ATCC 700913]GEL92897.1 membrane protein [Enterococcus villorum]
MSYLQRLIVNTLTFISLTVIFPQMIFVNSIWTAFMASFVLSILNMFVKPILTILSLPLTLFTLSLFTFVINAAILKMTSFFIGAANFSFASFGAAFLVAVIMSVINMIVSEHNSRG